MSAVKEYKVVEASGTSELSKTIKEWLRVGWVLQGGISVIYFGNHEYWFCQAMVKHHETT